MSKTIVLKIDDLDDFLYHNILSLLSLQETIIETVTERTIISVAPDFTVYPAQQPSTTAQAACRYQPWN